MVLKYPGSLFFVCYSPVSLMKASPIGFQSWVFWWPIPHVGALKVGALNVPLKETLGVGGAPLIIRCYVRCEVSWESMSKHFPLIAMWSFS